MALQDGRKGEEVAVGDLIDSADKFETEVFTDANDAVPGLGWELSQETQKTINDIDENIRAAEQLSGRLTVG